MTTPSKITTYITILKNNFLYFIIFCLTFIIILQICSSPKSIENPTTITKTIYIPVKGTTITQPAIIKTLPGKVETKYIPDENYDKLAAQYNELVKAYTNINIHKDSIKIEDFGYVNILDTVSHNFIKNRKTTYSFKFPVTTTTITQQPIKRNELYYGFGIEGDHKHLVNQFNIGLLLKTKQDNIYNLYGGIDIDGVPQIGLQMYWKIKLHR